MPNIIKTYICPSNPLPSLGVFIPTGNTSGNNLTNYMGIVGRERKDWRFPTSTPLSGLGEDSGVMAVVVATTASPFSKPIKVGFASVTDGLSNTLAFGERPPVPDLDWGWGLRGNPNLDSLIWSFYTAQESPSLGASDSVGPCPFPMYFQAPASPPRYCDGYHMWSFHTGGGNFALCDGSVRFINYSAGTKVIPAMSTKALGEIVQDE